MSTETGTPYSRVQLLAAFNKVCDKQNWKNPIKGECDKEDIEILSYAIPFFAGCTPTFTAIGFNRLRVEAPGYYLAVGA